MVMDAYCLSRFAHLTDRRTLGYNNHEMKDSLLLASALAAATALSASRMEPLPAGAGNASDPIWLYTVVVSESAADDHAWRAVADALAAKYAKPPFRSLTVIANPKDAAQSLRETMPRYVAFVVKPEEAGTNTVFTLHAMMKALDEDPYYDAVWGIVTGPTADAAMHVAAAAPVHPRTALTTTGVDFHPYDDATTISDSYAPGSKREEYARPNRPVAVVEKRSGSTNATRIVRGDTTSEFVSAWNALDPEFLATSSHASQRNLEMPFSTGNIVPRRGELWSLPDKKLIDYSTGQAASDASALAAATQLAAPKRDKLWIAAGNCLIGDYADNGSMAAALIGYGRVVQFMGYVKTTWFGEIGWETLAQFARRRATVAEAWYFAGQNLERKLEVMDNIKHDKTLAGRIWDRDGTVLWGDPGLDACLEDGRAPQQAKLVAQETKSDIRLTFEALEDLAAGTDKTEEVHVVHPFGVILPRSAAPYEIIGGEGLRIFTADDFALVTSWPAMRKGKVVHALLRAPGAL